jgi:uncharacterized membrane protein
MKPPVPGEIVMKVYPGFDDPAALVHNLASTRSAGQPSGSSRSSPSPSWSYSRRALRTGGSPRKRSPGFGAARPAIITRGTCRTIRRPPSTRLESG